MKYRYTDVPSLIQTDREEWEAICFICKKGGAMDFHHIMNGSKYTRQMSERIGAWIWLCPIHHRWIHGTKEGTIYQRRLKALVQERYEEDHSRREWMEMFHKNYREE